MMGRRWMAAGLALAVVMAACSVDPSASGPSAAPTLNPNQLEAQRRSAHVTPTPDPVATSGPAASPGPTTAPPVTPGPIPFDPALEAMLPASVRGVAMTRFSAPAAQFDTGGDICWVLCPGEPSRLSELSGVAVEDMTVAFAFPDQVTELPVGVLAIRLPGVATDELVDIRIREGGTVGSRSDLPADVRPLEVGPHDVTRVLYPPFYREEQGEYLLATDDVLFVVFGEPPTASGEIPEDVRLAIEALP